MSIDKSEYILPNNQLVVQLQCKAAFNALSQNEKLYTHYLSRASWSGSFISSIQISPESPLILALLHNIFLHDPDIIKLKESALAANVTEEEFTAFLAYSAGIYTNTGNYKGYGDTKVIPNLSQKKFETIIKLTKAYQQNNEKVSKLWKQIKDIVYALDNKLASLGIGDKGVTTYFSSNCTEDDAKKVTEFMQNKKLESFNTRVFKTSVNGKVVYNIRLASIDTIDQHPVTMPEESFNESTFKITRGDYNIILKHVVENLEKAVCYAANDIEKNMLKKYISHFTGGSLEDHKDGSRYWIQNKEPIVETYIGFIENYRDPVGERAEFEGFVAVVNKEMSKKFQMLVKNASTYLERMPWSKDFEKDIFQKPDFTSLEAVTMAATLIPVGINIPNYDSIRQTEGFKNVFLANVSSSPTPPDYYVFLSDKDKELLQKYRLFSNEIMTGLHELLGHGSGKLLMKDADGSYNFDHEHLIHPLNGEKVKYYLDGETYNSVFGALGSAYEECRAEGIGLYLSLEKEILKIFGHEGAVADDIIYVNWLMTLWDGCAGALLDYQVEKKQWLQAHSRGNFVLLQVCLEAGEDFVTVIEIEKGKNLQLIINRDKIKTVGKEAIGNFLKKLQIYKSTGDIKEAKKMFDKYSEVSNDGKYPWATWRNIVLAQKKPRKLFVQPNTFVSDDGKEITLKNYEPTFEGIIQSWTERFPDAAITDTLIELYKKDAPYFELGDSEL